MAQELPEDMEDTASNNELDHLFSSALTMDPGQRMSFIAKLEKENPVLASQLSSLLEAYARFDSKFEAKELGEAIKEVSASTKQEGSQHLTDTNRPTMLHPPMGPGTWSHQRMIGPYEMIAELGRGGMARVYRARQTHPHREVALKLIPGLGSAKAFFARFQREYQALGMMNHGNIATIYDAGETEYGDAWIAMELIDGVSLTKHCKKHNLSRRERLDLFIQVLDGMIHAHQQAVVHRDLKPSNIMVAQINGKPVAKIIDFGLAKGINSLQGEMVETRWGELLGTPAYMSPEQMTVGDARPADTRTDVYALGIILYEVLVDRHPLDLDELGGMPLHEAYKIFREQTIERPSKLMPPGKRLPRDLECIIEMAVAKDLERRYPSVTDFKADLERFLNHQPVSAKPPGAFYILGMFSKRHKPLAAGLLLIFLGLSAGLFLAVEGRREAVQGRRVAEASLAFLEEFLGASDPRAAGRDVTMMEALGQAEAKLQEQLGRDQDPRVILRVRTTLGRTFLGHARYEQAHLQLWRALQLSKAFLGPEHPETAQIHYLLGRVFLRLEQLDEAEQHFQAAYDIQKTHPRVLQQENLRSRSGLAEVLIARRLPQKAEAAYRAVIEEQLRILDPKHKDVLLARVGLANSLYRQKKWSEAAALYGETLLDQTEILGADHPETLATSANYGRALYENGDLDEAQSVLRKNLMQRAKVLGEVHPLTLSSAYSLALCLNRMEGGQTEAELVLGTYTNAFPMDPAQVPPGIWLKARNRLALLLKKRGETQAAVDILIDLVHRHESGQAATPHILSRVLQNLADFSRQLGDYDLALAGLQQKQENHAHETPEKRTMTWTTLGQIYQSLNQFEAADFWYCRAYELSREHFPKKKLARQCAHLYASYLEQRGMNDLAATIRLQIQTP